MLIAILLSGCATTPELLKQPPAKEASIGVMSFLGNDAALGYGTFFLYKQDKYQMKQIVVDDYIADTIKKGMQTYGNDNVFPYHLPQNNRIATQTYSQFVMRLNTLTVVERKYIEQIVSGKNFDYLVIIFPAASLGRGESAWLYKYGVFFMDSSLLQFLGFHFNYRIIIMDGKTFDIIAEKYKAYFIDMPEFKLDWPNNFPKMSNQQSMFYEKWFINFINNTMTTDVLTTMNLAQIK